MPGSTGIGIALPMIRSASGGLVVVASHNFNGDPSANGTALTAMPLNVDTVGNGWQKWGYDRDIDKVTGGVSWDGVVFNDQLHVVDTNESDGVLYWKADLNSAGKVYCPFRCAQSGANVDYLSAGIAPGVTNEVRLEQVTDSGAIATLTSANWDDVVATDTVEVRVTLAGAVCTIECARNGGEFSTFIDSYTMGTPWSSNTYHGLGTADGNGDSVIYHKFELKA